MLLSDRKKSGPHDKLPETFSIDLLHAWVFGLHWVAPDLLIRVVVEGPTDLAHVSLGLNMTLWTKKNKPPEYEGQLSG